MGIGFDLSTGVCHGDRKPTVAHHRQIDDVVSDERGLAGLEPFLAQYFFERGPFVLNALVHILQL